MDRIKSKGVNVEKKHLYWQHEAQKLKTAIDAYKGKKDVSEMEAAVWKLIRARGPLAIQRAKHAEARYSERLAALDAQRASVLKKQKAQKQAEREQQGFRPAMENFLRHIQEKSKATPCGRCGTTHVSPKFGGTCPALKKEEIESIGEVSNELLQRYKEKAGAQVDNPSTPSKLKYKRGLGHLMATVKQMKSGKPMPPIQKEEVAQVDELTNAAIVNYAVKAGKDTDTLKKHIDTGGEYIDIAKKVLARREKGLNRATNKLAHRAMQKDYERSSKMGLSTEEIKHLHELGRGTLLSYIKKAKNNQNKLANEEVHPNALHVQPVKVDGKQKYKVHAVGKNFSSGIKVGEHLTDTELDDFHEMGGKIKHIKEDLMKKLKAIMEEMKRGRGRPRKNPAPATKHDSDDEHEYGPSSRPASREGSSSHIVQQLASAAHDDLPKKGRDIDFKHHTGFVPQHVAKKAIEHYSSLKRSEDKANWAADHYEMHHKDFVKKFS